MTFLTARKDQLYPAATEITSTIGTKLWRSWKTYDTPKELHFHIASWHDTNPNLEYNFMDDNECSKFILDTLGSEIFNIYTLLPLNIMRADLWRIAVIHEYGGYYADLDIICKKPIHEFIDRNIDAVFMVERDNISNYFFGAKEKHPVLKITLDKMIEEAKNIIDKNAISFGMHSLHESVREYYNIIETDYKADNVQFLNDQELRKQRILIHFGSSLNGSDEYLSWRKEEIILTKEREKSNNILFVTSFNKNGYELYGKDWIKSFLKISNYYNKFKAKIYYQDFKPDIHRPNLLWENFYDIPNHKEWVEEFLNKSNHTDYVKTMTIRFSHKAFVINYALNYNGDQYVIWLDGDCIFNNTEYDNFPENILNKKFLACQVENAKDLNHIESGILIFDRKHKDTKIFNNAFRKLYDIDNIIQMGEPFDGFVIFKTLLQTNLDFVNLNEVHGNGGIQSDPTQTFLHPEIKQKFIHNIGWTGKNQYTAWDDIFKRDDVYKKMEDVLFGPTHRLKSRKEKAFDLMKQFKKARSHAMQQ